MKALSQAEYGKLRNLYESIYTPKEVEENLEFSDEELEDILEEVILDLLDEGYDIEEIEESFDDEFFEEILLEAMTPKQKEMRAKFKAQQRADDAAMTASKRKNLRAKAVADTKAKVKGTVKKGIEKAKSTVDKAKSTVVDEPARKYAEKRGVVKSKSGKSALGGGTGISSVKFKQRTPEGRREVRKAVAKDIASRGAEKVKATAAKAKETAGKAVRGAVASAQMKSGDSSKSASARFGRAADRAGSAVKSAASSAKSGLKGMIGKAARKVAGGADRVAKRMGEEFETYDVVVEFLCDYGIAEDLQEAQWLMVNEVDSEDIATILEAYGLDEAKADAELTPLQKIRKRNKAYAMPGEKAGEQTSNRRSERSSTRGEKKKRGAKSAFGTMRHVGGPYKGDNYSRYMGK